MAKQDDKTHAVGALHQRLDEKRKKLTRGKQIKERLWSS